jgi:hypothetical protein
MSSAGVQSWTLTAADNTTINGVNIAENCPAANINNAIRQAMSSVMQELVYQGADISASVSMSLAGVDFRFMAATGSASIVHVGTGRAGLVRNVVWNSQSTLIGSANIITDTGGNIVTGTNDMTMFTSLGSGAWRAVHFPADVQPAVVQVVVSQTGAVATGTTLIPIDDTIPQNNEGTQFLSATITPANSANKLVIDVIIAASMNTGLRNLTVALFQDSTANALAAGAVTIRDANYLTQLPLKFEMAAGTTSATTFKVRAGPDAAATVTLNGQLSGRFFGGVMISSITITEYSV